MPEKSKSPFCPSTSSSKVWSKRCRENLTKENEDLEARLREEMNSKLAKHEEKFAQKLHSMGTPQQSNIEPATKPTMVQSQTYEK